MKTPLIATIALFAYSIAFGQEKQNTSGGLWVVESNVRSPKQQVVKFYNQKQELIYQEAVSHRRLRIERPKIRKALDTALSRVLSSPSWVEKGTLAAVLRK
ncbi:MAG TPA: hypothetical protein VGE26_12335 [Sphingobacteriaceae bacterium]